MSEEFGSGQIKENESRWTKEGLLDIREDLTNEVIEEIPAQKIEVIPNADDGLDDDFQT